MGVFYLLFAFVLLRFLSEHVHDVSAAGKPDAVCHFHVLFHAALKVVERQENADAVALQLFSVFFHLSIIHEGARQRLLQLHHVVPDGRINFRVCRVVFYVLRQLIQQQHAQMLADFVGLYLQVLAVNMPLAEAVGETHCINKFSGINPAPS